MARWAALTRVTFPFVMATAVHTTVAFAQTASPAPTQSSSATPQTPPPTPAALADALFTEGQAMYDKGEYTEAKAKFEESHRLDPSPGALFNLAQCEKALGRFGSAIKRWKEGVARLQPNDPRIPQVQTRVAEAEKEAAKLAFTFPPNLPANAQITVDGESYLPNQLTSPIFVDSGEHTIVVTAQGYVPKTSTVSASNAATTQVTTTLGQPIAAAPPTTAIPQPTQAPASTTRSPEPFGVGQFFSQHRFSLITAGVAAGLAIGGIVVVTPVSSEFSAQVDKCNSPPAGLCTQEDFAHIHERANIANGLFVAAAVVGVATVPIFLFAEKGLSTTSTQVSFQLSPLGAGLTARY